MGIAIRRARPDEFESLGELLVHSYRSVPGAQDEPAYWARLRDVEGRAAVSTVLVAVDEDEQVLGGVTYVDESAPFAELPGEGEAEIRMLGVDVRAQGRGVGETLVRACLERAGREGRSRLWLATPPWMTEALRLYEKLGFTRVPGRDFTYTDPESGEVIELLVLARRVFRAPKAP